MQIGLNDEDGLNHDIVPVTETAPSMEPQNHFILAANNKHIKPPKIKCGWYHYFPFKYSPWSCYAEQP